MLAASQIPHKGDEKALRDALNNVLVSETAHHFWQEFFLHLAVSLSLPLRLLFLSKFMLPCESAKKYANTKKSRDLYWKTIFERFIPEGIVSELEE